jgi:hypothetical protein
LLFHPFYLYIVFGFAAVDDCLAPDRAARAGMNAEKFSQTEPAEIRLTLDKHAEFRL